jgi:hypothetical protein
VVWHVAGDTNCPATTPSTRTYSALQPFDAGGGRHDIPVTTSTALRSLETSASRERKSITTPAVHVFHMRDGLMTDRSSITNQREDWGDLYG